MESGSAWCVRKEVDGNMSCVVRRGWMVGASVWVKAKGDVGRSKGAGCTSGGWYEIMEVNMGSGSVLLGRRGLHGDVQ